MLYTTQCNVFMSRGQWAINFTRATTAMFTDFEWFTNLYSLEKLAFKVQRRVQNWFPYSQELTNVLAETRTQCNAFIRKSKFWYQSIHSLNRNPNNTHYIPLKLDLYIAGNKYMMSATVKAGTLSYVQLAPPGGISLEYAKTSTSQMEQSLVLQYFSSDYQMAYLGRLVTLNIILLYITHNSITGYWVVMIDSPTAPRVPTYVGTKDNPCNCYANWRCNLSERITPSSMYQQTYSLLPFTVRM